MALPIPIGRQREVLCLPAKGHFVILGTAGSGKTTLAILRLAYLSDPSTDHHGKTLLVTFNRALVAYLKHLQDRRLAHVVTRTTSSYHWLIVWYSEKTTPASEPRSGLALQNAPALMS